MPHLRFRAIDAHDVQELSGQLAAPLAEMLNTDVDNFTFEHLPTVFYTKSLKSEAYPFVEVHWFERPQELQDEVAAKLTRTIKALTGAADVVVVFCKLEKTAYYENGQHY